MTLTLCINRMTVSFESQSVISKVNLLSWNGVYNLRSNLLSRGGIYYLEIKIYLAEIDFTKWRLYLQ